MELLSLKTAKSTGEKYYFTGKACKNGHTSPRVVANRTCTECALSATQDWRNKNFDHIKSYSSNYHKSNPLVKRVSEHKRRVQKLEAGGEFTQADIIRLFNEQDGKCAICSCELLEYHIDHKLPLSRGGSNWPENLQLLCPTDNVRKWARTTDEYLTRLNLI